MKKKLFRPRKTPKQERSADTVDVILEAATRLLEQEDDDSRINTRLIAQKAGVSVGSLYQYFPGGEALMSMLIQRYVKKRFVEVAARIQALEHLPLEVAIRELVDSLIEIELRNRKIAKRLVEWLGSVGDFSMIAQIDEATESSIEACLRRVESKIRPMDLKFASFMLFNMVRAFLSAAHFRYPELLEKPETRAELTHLLLGYLSPSQLAAQKL